MFPPEISVMRTSVRVDRKLFLCTQSAKPCLGGRYRWSVPWLLAIFRVQPNVFHTPIADHTIYHSMVESGQHDDPGRCHRPRRGNGGSELALHLRQRGRDVVLVDRRGAGEETSYGNSGLIQREGVIPYTFPREFGMILSYAMNCRRDAVYHLSALPRIAPWLFRYWQNAAPKYIERSARALAPLMAQCVDEHEALIAEAGVAARALVRQNG